MGDPLGRGMVRHKLGLYGRELRFAASLPGSLGVRARLMAHTLAFHWRNFRGQDGPRGATLSVPLSIAGKRVEVTLRPAAGDLAIVYEIFTRNAYALDHHLLDPAHVEVIVDAGAHVGLASLYLADRYRRARIFSIEPNPENFALLKHNTTGEPRITPINACLTGLPDQQVFISTGGMGWSFQRNDAGRGVMVPGFSIGQLAEVHGFRNIDLLKLDIEGGEEDVLAHGDFLSMVRMIVAELHGTYDLRRFNADVSRYGFEGRVLENADEPGMVLAARR